MALVQSKQHIYKIGDKVNIISSNEYRSGFIEIIYPDNSYSVHFTDKEFKPWETWYAVVGESRFI